MKPNTHSNISTDLVGKPVELASGKAVAELTASTEMAADERGLVHGGFAFGLADYAAMLAVNDPNVVLGAAETKFLAPVRVGEKMTAEAKVVEESGKKRRVECRVSTNRPVLEGVFTCFVLPRHVLDQDGADS